MNADERLNKRIEIAARIASDLITRYNRRLMPTERHDIGTDAVDIADAIIDTAIGDMTAEPK